MRTLARQNVLQFSYKNVPNCTEHFVPNGILLHPGNIVIFSTTFSMVRYWYSTVPYVKIDQIVLFLYQFLASHISLYTYYIYVLQVQGSMTGVTSPHNQKKYKNIM